MRGDQISRRQVQKTRRFMNSFPNTIKFTGIPKMTVQARQINPKVTHLEQTVERNHCVWLIFCATHRSGTSENRFSKRSSRSEWWTEGLHFPPSVANQEHLKYKQLQLRLKIQLQVNRQVSELQSAGWTTASRHPFFMHPNLDECSYLYKVLKMDFMLLRN